MISVRRKWEALRVAFSNFLAFVFNDEPRTKTLITSSLLSSPQGTGPQ